jgi:outer membrane protein
MKNLSLILNGILLVAVIALYILFFSGSHCCKKSGNSSNNESNTGLNENGIVFISIDSVLSKYDMYADVQKDLQQKLKISEDQLGEKEKSYRKAYEDFQYKAGKHLVTQVEAEEIQQKLAQQEQELYQLQNELRGKLNEEEQVAQRKVLYSIAEFLESQESTKNQKYVLGTSFGGNVLYANPKLNISSSVIEGLNKQYNANKVK